MAEKAENSIAKLDCRTLGTPLLLLIFYVKRFSTVSKRFSFHVDEEERLVRIIIISLKRERNKFGE